jgi:hypothetical protein
MFPSSPRLILRNPSIFPPPDLIAYPRSTKFLLPSHSSPKNGPDCCFFTFFRPSDQGLNSDREGLKTMDVSVLWLGDEIGRLENLKKEEDPVFDEEICSHLPI